jgi:hypothetical protein
MLDSDCSHELLPLVEGCKRHFAVLQPMIQRLISISNRAERTVTFRNRCAPSMIVENENQGKRRRSKRHLKCFDHGELHLTSECPREQEMWLMVGA